MLRDWWASGGQEWLASYPKQLEASLKGAELHVVVPPDAREWIVDREERRGEWLDKTDAALVSLSCPPNDSVCGETQAQWLADVDEALRKAKPTCGNVKEPGPVGPACAEKARAADPAQQYQVFRSCLEERRTLVPRLPLVRLRAPTQGWLLLGGRRGHYDFCDELWAFNISNGSVFTVESCSGLALRGDGSVDAQATDTARKERVRAGTVNTQQLRKLLVALLLNHHVDEGQTNAETYLLPRGMTLSTRPITARASGCVSITSGESRLGWEWRVGDGLQANGRFAWSGKFATDVVLNALLKNIEQGLDEGCPAPAAPMRELSAFAFPGVSRRDGAETRARTREALLKAMAGWKCEDEQ